MSNNVPSGNTTNRVRDSLLLQGNAEQRRIVLARDAVIQKYCTEHGISKDEISSDQLLEIRSLPEWRTPT